MAFLEGKKILITGLLSNRSIALGIAEACRREGAELAFTYVGERFKDRITAFAKEMGSSMSLQKSPKNGDVWMVWSILSGLHRVKRLPVTSLTVSPVKTSGLPMISLHTAIQPWSKLHVRCWDRGLPALP